MYDLQVETSDMDFTLIYQALPKSLSLGTGTSDISKLVLQCYDYYDSVALHC